ncbi:MAG: hypothetical protein U1C56_02455, partial [Candidatus Curtissbacteria bacterium]|nr:hypothetical protein [Candidatus Curtissbacteria bacterium]
MTDGGPSAAEMGIDLEDISEKAGPKTVEDASKTPRLKDLIPIANSQEELQDLTTIHGLSSENELSRSAFYRNKPQTEVLRKCLQDLPKDKPFDILNIGPANG